MYKSSRRAAAQKRRRRRRRHMVQLTLVAVLIVAGCLLMGAGRPSSDKLADFASRSAKHPQQSQTLSSGAQEPQETQPVTPVAPSEPEHPTQQPTTSPSNDWKLLLVNPWNPLPEDFAVTLTQLKNGHAVDERCYPDLQAMMDDCRAAGLSPVICSSYRSQEKQEQLFNNKVNRLIAQGYSSEEARIEAAKSVAVPGTSEHQLGLAVDLVDLSNQNLNKSQESTAVQKWLMANSWRYGFILRYPNEKSEITGIIYEPWHYRYVGKEAAQEIYEQGICLEEYLNP